MSTRKEIVEAAMKGVREFVTTTRGANICGAKGGVYENPKGFRRQDKGSRRFL